ncbi:MAG TPA: DNA mismatch repair endonuclease MutL [Thermoflexales bacterium]|nr:DNA mismatch repair endonuclease MutL [Thermoflexales bacterium]
MPIHVLPDTLVARIAAGEVVERPASAVKEMVENAIDAGASDIRVECAEGGRALLRVTDNGSGIRADEVELAFTHHATSKLSTDEDLTRIKTLGFRGEALASIASVSIVTCATRHADETTGTLIRFDNGRIVQHDKIGRPAGTTMTVENLFARVPARLKFLKSNQTERGHIDAIVTRYALVYPSVRFSLVHDGRVTFQTQGSGRLRDALAQTHGAEVAERLIPIGEMARDDDAHDMDMPEASIEVSGYASLPTLDHNNRSKIQLFVNGRPIQDVKLSYAVIQAYHTLLMVGRYPIAVVMIRMPVEDVDVNAHPAKAEVRFREPEAVFSAVQRAIRRELLARMAPPEPPSVLSTVDLPGLSRPEAPVDPNAPIEPGWSAGAGQWPAPRDGSAYTAPLHGSGSWERVGIARQSQGGEFSAASPANTGPMPTRSLPALRILGQLALAYVIAEGPEGLYLIDQHAAHERVLYERMLAQRELGPVVSQALLDPLPVQLPADSAWRVEENLLVLRDLGFDLEAFGANTWLVRAVPPMMAQDDIAAALREIAGDLESGDAPLRRDIEARILRRVCKRMAIKAGRVLALSEMQALVRDLEACESPRTCPHGRPTMLQIGVGQLEKQFGRLG